MVVCRSTTKHTFLINQDKPLSIIACSHRRHGQNKTVLSCLVLSVSAVWTSYKTISRDTLVVCLIDKAPNRPLLPSKISRLKFRCDERFVDRTVHRSSKTIGESQRFCLQLGISPMFSAIEMLQPRQDRMVSVAAAAATAASWYTVKHLRDLSSADNATAKHLSP